MSSIYNPFSLDLVTGKDLFNRVKEKEELARYARSGGNVVLMSPRKSGKTFLVKELLAQLEQEGMIIAYVDLFSVVSVHDFIQKFWSALLCGFGNGIDPGTFIQKASDLFKHITSGFSLTRDDQPRWFIKLDHDDRFQETLGNILRDLYEYVQKEKVRACIVLDEFQEIANLKESKQLEGVLRGQIQFHHDISYIFVGSRRTKLREIFSDSRRPFYKSAFYYDLEAITKEEFTQYIIDKFESSGKICSQDAADLIYDRVRGYAYYVQKLSLLSWDLTDKVLDADFVDKVAFGRLIDSERYEFESIWDRLKTRNNRVLLRALADEPTSKPYAHDLLRRYSFSLGGIQTSMKALLADDIIEIDENGLYRITDPVLVYWARR